MCERGTHREKDVCVCVNVRVGVLYTHIYMYCVCVYVCFVIDIEMEYLRRLTHDRRADASEHTRHVITERGKALYTPERPRLINIL